MSIPYDPSPPLVTPERLLAEQCQRLGVEPEDLALPQVLVGTFQGASYQRLIEVTGATQPRARSDGTAIESGISIGELPTIEAGISVGKPPNGGQPLAVARLPAGAPSAVLALESAIARGVQSVLIVGSAGSLQPDLPMGSTVIVSDAVREEGTSYHYVPGGVQVRADPEIVELLTACARAAGLNPQIGSAWTTDAPLRETVGAVARHSSRGVKVVEMEASAIFAVSQVRGVRAGLLVAVSDELSGTWRPGFLSEEYLQSLSRGIDIALAAAGRLLAEE
ncbi:MAG: nucleoside phosphorylase [Chloroflexota bacterium]|nr:nucleoside phosphorylase [Chloroflexota bacterium]